MHNANAGGVIRRSPIAARRCVPLETKPNQPERETMPAPVIPALTGAEQAIFAALWKRIETKAAKNELLNAYYDGHRVFQDLGISVPPQMARVRAALGWPAKAVSTLARKHVFEGYSLDGRLDPFDVTELLVRNSFDVELMQAIQSAYKHSCSFLVVGAGDTSAGEPPVVIQARDARWTSVQWDTRRRCVTAGLAINGATSPDGDGWDLDTIARFVEPSDATLFLPGETIRLTRGKRGAWQVQRLPNPAGRVLIEMLTYDPQISRPFGRSRISREVRYLTDCAIRTMVRTEASAEFFSSPQRYVLGADEDAFAGVDRWSAITGRILALSPNENGDIPSVGQFSQLSMDPHLSMYRQLAQNLCSATNMPTSSVGIFADNPASAEAMQAAEYALSDEAEYQWRVFTPALRRIIEDVVMVRDRSVTAPDESWKLAVNWTPARYVSPQASSDFIVKIAQAMPDVATTTVGMRRAGFTQQEIDQMQAETRRTGATSILDRLDKLAATREA